MVGRGGDGKGSAESKEIGDRVDDERERGQKEVVSRDRSEKLDLVGEGVKIGQEQRDRMSIRGDKGDAVRGLIIKLVLLLLAIKYPRTQLTDSRISHYKLKTNTYSPWEILRNSRQIYM